MIDQVFKYPGQVSIYSAVRLPPTVPPRTQKPPANKPQGALTNIATAIRLNSSFASTARELVIMGGYVDLNLYQLTSPLAQDIGSDFNFLVDPEAAHIAVTAPFPSITIAGNVANQQYLTQSQVNTILNSSDNAYAQLMSNYFIELPLWDETAAAIMAYPELVTGSVEAFMDVNTAFDSPDLGRTHLWSKQFAPSHTRSVHFVTSVDQAGFFQRVESVLAKPGTC
jgi:inosine-uridine nucleoside N-ribohydrolase